MQTDFLANYETPVWTLIGVVVGFALSGLYAAWLQRRNYRKRVSEAIERIKGGMHLKVSQLGSQRISDLLPQFKEEDQIKILGEVGSESSLNAPSDQVTDYVLEELRWRCILYELFPQHHLVKRSKNDARFARKIQSCLWEIGANVVEFRQSEALLAKVFALGSILHTYAAAQGYHDVITAQISMYGYIGKHCVGIKYPDTGYKVLNFRYGIDESIRQLADLSKKVRRSSSRFKRKDRLLAECETAEAGIREELARTGAPAAEKGQMAL
jgi:hypothetical protein